MTVSLRFMIIDESSELKSSSMLVKLDAIFLTMKASRTSRVSFLSVGHYVGWVG